MALATRPSAGAALDRLVSPYLRFLGPRYRLAIILIVQHGPAQAHVDVREVLDEEIDEILKLGSRLGSEVQGFRERIQTCHRENACFYKLVCEHAATTIPDLASDLLAIAALLPEPPSSVRAAFLGVEPPDPAEHQRFRFRFGADDVPLAQYAPSLLAKSHTARTESFLKLLRSTPKTLRDRFIRMVAKGWAEFGYSFRKRDLRQLTEVELTSFSDPYIWALPMAKACGCLLERWRSRALNLDDLRFLAPAFRSHEERWEVLFRYRPGSRTDAFHFLFGRQPADTYRDMARHLLPMSSETRGRYLALLTVSELRRLIACLLAQSDPETSNIPGFLGQLVLWIGRLADPDYEHDHTRSEDIASFRAISASILHRLPNLENLGAFLQRVHEYACCLDPNLVIRRFGAVNCQGLMKAIPEWEPVIRNAVLVERITTGAPISSSDFLDILDKKLATRTRLAKLHSPDGAPTWQAVLSDYVSVCSGIRPTHESPRYASFLTWIGIAPVAVKRAALLAYPQLSSIISFGQNNKKTPSKQGKQKGQIGPAPSARMAVAISQALGGWSAKALRFLINTSWSSLQKQESKHGHVFDHLYQTYTLPKKAGGTRTITAPCAMLKSLQRRILVCLLSQVELPDSIHGFRTGRNVLTNALPHAGKSLVLNLDIDSFFPSVRYGLILRALSRTLGDTLDRKAIRFLADVCSYQGALPTGAPTSPAVANLVLAGFDKAIASLSDRMGITYTRYADDLTFSGNDAAKRIIPFVVKLLDELGLELDPEKVNLFRRGRRQMVTGLVVNERPNLPRRTRKRLRAAVHRVANHQDPTWHGRPMSLPELVGHLSHLQSVNPVEGKRLKAKLRGSS